MALTGTHSVGIPVVLLHECEALIITVELTNGEVCRGRLTKAEDCFNLWYLRFCAAAEQLNYNEKGKLRKNTLTEKPKVSWRCNELWWLR